MSSSGSNPPTPKREKSSGRKDDGSGDAGQQIDVQKQAPVAVAGYCEDEANKIVGQAIENVQEKMDIGGPSDEDWLIPGQLLRTILEVSKDMDVKPKQFPQKGAFVEAIIEGVKGDEVFYPKRQVEIFIGDGFLEGLPCGVDAGLLYFRVGEFSLLTITSSYLLRPIFDLPEDTFGDKDAQQDGYCYYVTLNKFENLPLTAEEWPLERQLDLCDRLNNAAKKLQLRNEILRALEKYDFIRNTLEDFVLAHQAPENFGLKRLILLLKSLIGMSTCLLFLERKHMVVPIELLAGIDPVVYAERALVLKPDSVDAIRALGDIHLSREESQAAFKWFTKAHRLQINNPEITQKIVECLELEKSQKALATELAKKMLGMK